MIDCVVIERCWDRRKDAFEIHAENSNTRADLKVGTTANRAYHEVPMATVPPMRICSPAFESSNSGRRNRRLPAAMRRPPNPLTVPDVDVLRKTLLPNGSVRADLIRVTPRPPPTYGWVRPSPKYLMMRPRVAVTVESKTTPLSKLRSAFWVSTSPSMPQPCGDRNPTPPPIGTPWPMFPSSSQSWTTPVVAKISRDWADARTGERMRAKSKRIRIVISGNARLSVEAARKKGQGARGEGQRSLAPYPLPLVPFFEPLPQIIEK